MGLRDSYEDEYPNVIAKLLAENRRPTAGDPDEFKRFFGRAMRLVRGGDIGRL